jgi:hypothetical protein
MTWFDPPPRRPKPAMPEAYDASGLRPAERRGIAQLFWVSAALWMAGAILVAAMAVWAFGAAWPRWARIAFGSGAAFFGAVIGAAMGQAVSAAVARIVIQRHSHDAS